MRRNVSISAWVFVAAIQAGCLDNPRRPAFGTSPRASVAAAQDLLDGSTIPQFVEPLPVLSGRRVDGTRPISVDMREFEQQVLPSSFYAGLPAPFNKGTRMWGYAVGGQPPQWPAATIEAHRGIPTRVTYTNSLALPGGAPPLLQPYLTQDLTLKWADPIGISRMNGCVQGTENGGVAGTLIGGTQNAYDPNGPCAVPYAGPVPVSVHLHGGEVPSAFDGHPDAWFTPGLAQTGPAFVSNVFLYPNQQEATALWFHDHSLGTTRLNVYSGLAGFYLIRDLLDTGRPDNPLTLPAGEREVELLIADRIFDSHGQLIFPDGSSSANGTFNGYNGAPGNPNLHPFVIPEFFGDVMTVNGKSWPYLSVKPKRYRFRVVNGSNARFYSMQLSLEGRKGAEWTGLATALTDPNGVGVPGPHIWQIGSDGGFLDAPTDIDALRMPDTTALLNIVPDPPHLFLAPAERADIIIDFAGMAGKRFILVNNAVAPFPNGGATVEPMPGPPGSPQTSSDLSAQIMEFRVEADDGSPDVSFNPAGHHPALRASPIPNLRTAALSRPDVRRQLVLDEVEDVATGAPVEVMLNNSHWDGLREGSTDPIPGAISNGHGASATETPRVGALELWEIANLTPDAHPIHIHLVEFQVIEVQPFLSEHGLCDQFSAQGQDFADAQEYRAAWDSTFTGGVFNGFSFAPQQFIPGYGPPSSYAVPNADGAVGGNPAFGTTLNGISAAFVGPPVRPAPRDAGWKDTFKLFPCSVTRLAVRWAPQDRPAHATHPGKNDFPFDPTTAGPGYAWHCHILDHEDNEMMRPLLLTK